LPQVQYSETKKRLQPIWLEAALPAQTPALAIHPHSHTTLVGTFFTIITTMASITMAATIITTAASITTTMAAIITARQPFIFFLKASSPLPQNPNPALTVNLLMKINEGIT
jgi:hypothetical protein